MSESWQWDVSRSNVYQFLEVSSKGRIVPLLLLLRPTWTSDMMAELKQLLLDYEVGTGAHGHFGAAISGSNHLLLGLI